MEEEPAASVDEIDAASAAASAEAASQAADMTIASANQISARAEHQAATEINDYKNRVAALEDECRGMRMTLSETTQALTGLTSLVEEIASSLTPPQAEETREIAEQTVVEMTEPEPPPAVEEGHQEAEEQPEPQQRRKNNRRWL